MPRKKQFCPYENEFFDPGEFETVEGTQVHNVEPLHRSTDGVLMRREGDELFPVSELAFEPLSDAPPPEEDLS